MKTKSKLGMGLKKKLKKSSISSNKVINTVGKLIKSDGNSVIKTALNGSRKIIQKSGGRKNVKVPKVITTPKKICGVIPSIPIFAGLGALGSIAGVVSGIAKAVNDYGSA